MNRRKDAEGRVLPKLARPYRVPGYMPHRRKAGPGRLPAHVASGYSKLARRVAKHLGLWEGRGTARRTAERERKLKAREQFELGVQSYAVLRLRLGERGATRVWRRGPAHVAACLRDPVAYREAERSKSGPLFGGGA